MFVLESRGSSEGVPMRLRALIICSGILLFLSIAQAQGKAPDVVKYHATLETVKYVYGVAPPVARLAPGDVLETNTLDAFGDAIEKPGDTLALVKGDNPLTGPFYIEGAEPGDTIAIDFVTLEVNSTQGVGAFAPGFGALNSTNYTPMIQAPLPERIWLYPIHPDDNTATFQAHDSNYSVKIPLHPFLGCIGVAPSDGEARSSVVPAEFGGNMDAPEASVGNTLYLPVSVAGALLSFGDGHAAMGDGEVDGTAIEISMKVQLQVNLIKNKKIDWPRFENDEYIMSVGI